MDKASWLSALRAALAGLPEADITRSADYYTELIEDGMEDGQSEFEAVSALPDPEEAARQILLEQPLGRVVQVKAARRKRSAWEIILLVLGSPVWLPLLLSLAVLLLTAYLLVWVAVLVLWTFDLSAGFVAVAGPVGLVLGILNGTLSGGLFSFGLGLIGAGVAILLFFAGLWAARESARLGAALLRTVKQTVLGKGAAA